MNPIDETYKKNFTKNFYKFLKEGHVIRFKRMRAYDGYILQSKYHKDSAAEVVLDPAGSVLSTLIHEYLHYKHPDWSERRVLKAETILINSLSSRQIRNIVKRIAEVI